MKFWYSLTSIWRIFRSYRGTRWRSRTGETFNVKTSKHLLFRLLRAKLISVDGKSRLKIKSRLQLKIMPKINTISKKANFSIEIDRVRIIIVSSAARIHRIRVRSFVREFTRVHDLHNWVLCRLTRTRYVRGTRSTTRRSKIVYRRRTAVRLSNADRGPRKPLICAHNPDVFSACTIHRVSV